VVWILIGVTVCSVMTATLTDALMSVKLEKYDVTSGKRVGSLIVMAFCEKGLFLVIA